MNELPLSKIIDVTLMATPIGLSNFNVNTLALFTNETAGAGFGADGFKIYTSPDGVATDFGVTSETYLQAVAVFSQNPNILAGGGYLVVIALATNANATHGTMLTLANGSLASLQAITAGSFAITVDGVAHNVTGLNFSNAASLDAVAAIINGQVSGYTSCTYDATANGNAGGFLFTSGTTGVTSKVSAMSAVGSGTDVSGEGFLNGAGNVRIINGQAAASKEDLVSAIVRTKSEVYYFGIASMTAPTVADALNLAGYVQTQDKLLFLGRSDAAEVETLFGIIQGRALSHTRMLYYTVDAASARIAVAAYASRLLSVNFTGSNTMATMNLKTLIGIDADSDAATEAIYAKAEAYGFDIYVSIAGDPCVLSFGANYYSDAIYGQLWLKLALQVAGFNYLKTTNQKIPQTEPGMDGLKGAYASICNQAITNGYLAAGLLWTSPTTFGNQADMLRNITDKGYYIYSQPIALQSSVDRTARKAPLIQIGVKEAGAIHHSDVIVQVN